MSEFDKTLVWFRRDLRSFDHAALHHALKQSRTVFCAFIFDRDILDPLHIAPGPTQDRRVAFIHASVTELERDLRHMGGTLIARYASATTEIPKLAAELGVDAVFANLDYEPGAVRRDEQVAQALAAQGRRLICFKDQVIFHRTEVQTLMARPFSVFTPYKNAWLKVLQPEASAPAANPFLAPYLTDPFAAALAAPQQLPTVGSDMNVAPIPSLADMGFAPVDLAQVGIEPGMSGGEELLHDFGSRMADYAATRDFPALAGTSTLSVHLRFGTVSIRGLVRRALEAIQSGEGGSGATTWLSELIWRDFYFMILDHHPHVAERAFKPEYDRIEWEAGAEADAAFDAWCAGQTGYPLVDAAMLQLNRTGFMHNRLRMVTASFLIKDLGIDWRWGEAYFARQLNDYDLSANNGGWQWAASSGCDAQPYFRIFNPVRQSERFDPDGEFIRRYLPQLGELDKRQIHAPWLLAPLELQATGVVLGHNYPAPIVDHDDARKKTLARYAVVKQG